MADWRKLSQAAKVRQVLRAFDIPVNMAVGIARRRFSIFTTASAQFTESLSQIQDAFVVPLTDSKALILWEDK